MPLTAADDDFHLGRSEDRSWTETAWFSWMVPERKLMGHWYLVMRANVGDQFGVVCVFDDRSVLPWELTRQLETGAPVQLPVPSGRTVLLTYREDGTVMAAVKLQELFGLAETPRIGPRQEPVILELLAPNGRPVQTTRDLRSFWARTYPEVRKELRGRYPRHPWPDDPWTATPTHRTVCRA